MSRNNITVFFTSYSDGNPYYNLLFEALEEQGIEPIREPIPILLPLTRAIFRNEKIDVVQLDWLYRFYFDYNVTPYRMMNYLVVLGRTTLFCLDIFFVYLSQATLVWTIHNKYHHERKYYRIEKYLNVYVANLVDSITVKCDSAKDVVQELYRVHDSSKIFVVPDGNYTEAYQNSVDKDTARSKLGINEDLFIYLFFGLIRPYKGISELVDAYQELNDTRTELWIVGNPDTEEMARMMEQLAEEEGNIRIRARYIPTDEVQYYLNASDVLVLPYQDVLNSGSVHLGLTFGKAMVVPEIGCIPSLISEENQDLLYSSETEDGLKNALRKAQNSEIERIGEANRNRSKVFSWEKSAKLYKIIYRM